MFRFARTVERTVMQVHPIVFPLPLSAGIRHRRDARPRDPFEVSVDKKNRLHLWKPKNPSVTNIRIWYMACESTGVASSEFLLDMREHQRSHVLEHWSKMFRYSRLHKRAIAFGKECTRSSKKQITNKSCETVNYSVVYKIVRLRDSLRFHANNPLMISVKDNLFFKCFSLTMRVYKSSWLDEIQQSELQMLLCSTCFYGGI